MFIHNKDELNAMLLQKTKNALIKAQEQVYAVVGRFVKEYYAEYNPVDYQRTYQFYRSLVKSNIEPAGGGKQLGWKATVYFDLNRLDYYMKTTKRKGTQRNDKKHFDDPLTEKQVVHRILNYGYHAVKPRKIKGTPVWYETQLFLDKEGFNLLKKMLLSEGISIK